MVVGIDIVQWMIRIASGAKLTVTQDRIYMHGNAIECRINAEDPERNFLPSCGTLDFIHIPGGPCVRFDTAIYQNYTVPPYYDSMIGKLIVQARSRELAIRKMKMALTAIFISISCPIPNLFRENIPRALCRNGRKSSKRKKSRTETSNHDNDNKAPFCSKTVRCFIGL